MTFLVKMMYSQNLAFGDKLELFSWLDTRFSYIFQSVTQLFMRQGREPNDQKVAFSLN